MIAAHKGHLALAICFFATLAAAEQNSATSTLSDTANTPNQDYLQLSDKIGPKSPWTDYGSSADDMDLLRQQIYDSGLMLPSLRAGYPAALVGAYQYPYRSLAEEYEMRPENLVQVKRGDPDAKNQYRLRFGRSGVRLRFGRSEAPRTLRFG